MGLKVTAADYAEILEDDWSPGMRMSLEADRQRALAREAKMAKLDEESRKRAAMLAWQRDTVRAASLVLPLQFIVAAWEAREGALPTQLNDYRRKLVNGREGMRKRLRRAREEATAGDKSQELFLCDYAELFAAIEAA